MSELNLDWGTIRPLSGTREKGFEELCSQLARCQSPAGARFIRKGTPDAGVECYAILPDGSEWAWQAKYFLTSPEASQWKQVNESVVTALKKHPDITKYFVCMPLDLPDGRVERATKSTGETKRTKSAQDRWTEHVARWKKATAQQSDRKVQFVFWGSHELLDLLTRPEHVGRVRFFFDQQRFDKAWFSARLEEAIRTAGPRYTPEVHVDLPVVEDFAAFGRTSRFFERTKALALPIRERFQTAHHTQSQKSEPEIDTAAAELSNAVSNLLEGFGALEAQPTGELPFAALLDMIKGACSVADRLIGTLKEYEEVCDDENPMVDGGARAGAGYRVNPFRDHRIAITYLVKELRQASEHLQRADDLSSRRLLLLRGLGGTGKTHLLCDVARRRIEDDCPTVLLMGQRFSNNIDPWQQVLHQLDLPGISAEVFVGVLEAAAQASEARAFILLDAINEGTGRTIWPLHMAAFLAHIERSRWIGVVMAVHTSYQELVIPAEIRAKAALVELCGFDGHEYDATKTFFLHYGLELPSTPLLDPEFRNPLFLKTLCLGLCDKGERRLPRGFHGITAVFELYLSAVNKRLATRLDFDPRTSLVRQALEAVAFAMIETGKRWLNLLTAKKTVDALLPNRSFERSLYRGLVVEGVIVEEAHLPADNGPREVAFVAYERFADHLIARTLLDRHFEPSNPASSFGAGGGLEFIGNSGDYVSPGLLDALWVQVAERCRKELVVLAPSVADRFHTPEAFRQSLVWRATDAFSEGTRDALISLCRTETDLHGTLDVLLTVAVLPQHPFNARFLDQRLRRYAMADRDAWWSIYLHHAWGNHSAVDRLVDWASSIDSEMLLKDELVELAGTALAWMFTCSNRFLRDRATMALVGLCSGRLRSMSRLFAQFSDVDDPYVTERVYAAAYGVAMRCHDPVEVGALATVVYECVFANASPPAHILLRDYARGVIERALHLRSSVTIDPARVRPRYTSHWPDIPSEAAIEPFLPDWSKGSYDSGEPEWARNRIATTVMDGDFARKVIQTDWGNWLAVTHAEAPWEPPPSPKAQLQQFGNDLSSEERHVWDKFTEADENYNAAMRRFIDDWFAQRSEDGNRVSLDKEQLLAELEKTRTPEMDATSAKREEALATLYSVLSVEHANRLDTIRAAEENNETARKPPRLELEVLKRYILKRVFDLGWTIKRFGKFDRFWTDYKGRRSSKAERIGKKYQWIAYHEILAFVSDRFQYRSQYWKEEGDKAYEGPWQGYLRDIDPSCTLRSAHEVVPWLGHAPAWWGPTLFDPTCPREDTQEWVQRTDDLPKIEDLLCVANPDDEIRWLNGQGYFHWMQHAPSDLEPWDVERGELWYLCTGYLIREDDTAAFLTWAKGIDFSDGWMPDPAEGHSVFLGEHAWSPASRYFERQYDGDDGWMNPGQDCPVKICSAAFKYQCGLSRDGSIDEGFALRLPSRELVTKLDLCWSGKGADFMDGDGHLATQDPTAHAAGPSALLLRSDLIQDMRRSANLTLCWAIQGEKRVLARGWGGLRHPILRMSGAYVLEESGISGFINHILDNTNESLGSSGL